MSPFTPTPVRLRLSGRNSGKIPERPRKRSQSVSWNSPREYGWDPPNPFIQSIWGFQSISRILSPQYGRGRLFFQKWFRRGPLRAGHGIYSSTGSVSDFYSDPNTPPFKLFGPSVLTSSCMLSWEPWALVRLCALSHALWNCCVRVEDNENSMLINWSSPRPSISATHADFRSPHFGVGRRGSPWLVPICSDFPFSSDLFRLRSLFSGMPRFVPICSNLLRFLPICFQNKSGKPLPAEPFCKSSRFVLIPPLFYELFRSASIAFRFLPGYFRKDQNTSEKPLSVDLCCKSQTLLWINQILFRQSG